MKTRIIIQQTRTILKKLDHLVTMSPNDIVTVFGKEYQVLYCDLNIDENYFDIIVKLQ